LIQVNSGGGWVLFNKNFRRRRQRTEGHLLDIVYLALGLGIFALMGLYARWATNA
jgi:hypothetical protein